MATPFPFVSGAVLTAAQLNSITELPVNAKTASYTLVASDAGDRIQMTSASATTITVNTGLFSAGQSVSIYNNGAGSCTITPGTATVTTNGALTGYNHRCFVNSNWWRWNFVVYISKRSNMVVKLI